MTETQGVVLFAVEGMVALWVLWFAGVVVWKFVRPFVRAVVIPLGLLLAAILAVFTRGIPAARRAYVRHKAAHATTPQLALVPLAPDPVSAPAPEPRCGRCGEAVGVADRYCAHCGASLHG